MKRIIGIVVMVLSFLIVCPYVSQAGEMDILVDKLVEKGILTPVEAQIILDETKQEVAREVSEGKSHALPKWVQNTKLTGDLRLRYEYADTALTEAVNRGRLRYRLGLETKLGQKVKVGFGLASGGQNPRSTNIDFQDTFSSKDISLDLAYAEYKPWNSLSVVGGKFKRKPYLWQPGDMLWDSDLNPEGASLAWNGILNDRNDLFANAGMWVLDESTSDVSDPFMFYVQPGLKTAITDRIGLKIAVAVYGFSNVEGASLDNSSQSNTRDGDGNYLYKYNSINPAVELAFKKPFDGFFNYASIFGHYAYNFDNDADDNNGFQTGFKIGDKKVKKPGQWQFKYMYTRLEKDAFLDTFPDSDRHGGITDARGHETSMTYGLAKGISIGFDYYYSERIEGDNRPFNLAQVDLMFKF